MVLRECAGVAGPGLACQHPPTFGQGCGRRCTRRIACELHYQGCKGSVSVCVCGGGAFCLRQPPKQKKIQAKKAARKTLKIRGKTHFSRRCSKIADVRKNPNLALKQCFEPPPEKKTKNDPKMVFAPNPTKFFLASFQ